MEIKAKDIPELIAPKILRNELAKKILALQQLTVPENGEKLHVMLVGEPASGKSEIGIDISKLNPASAYASSDITKRGLTERLEEIKGGTFVLDEFDKVPKDVRSGLLEVMQTGERTIDKHRYHESVETPCNVVVICNPTREMFMDDVSIHRQVDFSLVLMTRFHLIIPFHSVDKSLYPEIAEKYEFLHGGDERRRKMWEVINKYRKLDPECGEGVKKKMGRWIKQMKELSTMDEIISPRLIEGSLSMLKANARMNERAEVTNEDYKEVRKILEDLFL